MTPFFVLNGDCRTLLKQMPDACIDCCVTSPPYFGLRDYGHAGQIGLEKNIDDYVAQLVSVFSEVRRVLKDTGTLWLNLGDSYARAPKKGGSGPNGKNKDQWGYGLAQSAKIGSSDGGVGRASRPGSRAIGQGIKPKDLIGIPWMVAFALRADGWYLRQDIIWQKPNPMPESVKDRCTKAHEYLFLLSKSEKYYFDSDAMQEPVQSNKGNATTFRGGSYINNSTFDNAAGGKRTAKGNHGRSAGNKTHKYVTAYEGSETEEHRTKAGLMAVADKVWETRNRRDVWTIATKPFKEAHFATFPPALVEPCILAGCPVDGCVLDPFGGAGTTGMVAVRNQRKAVLLELNADYAIMAKNRIEQDIKNNDLDEHDEP